MFKLFSLFKKNKKIFNNNSNFLVVDKDLVEFTKKIVESTKNSEFRIAIVTNKEYPEMYNTLSTEELVFIRSSPYLRLQQ